MASAPKASKVNISQDAPPPPEPTATTKSYEDKSEVELVCCVSTARACISHRLSKTSPNFWSTNKFYQRHHGSVFNVDLVLGSDSAIVRDAMPKIIFDPRYKALPAMKDKTKAFEDYKVSAADKEHLEKKQKRTVSKEKLMVILNAHPRITRDTRFREVRS